MLTKFIAFLLVCTVTLLMVPPVNNFAQTQFNTAADHYLRNARTERTSDLKASFAAEIARIKAGSLPKADFGRIQTPGQNPKPQSSFPRRDKIFLAVFIIATAALVVVLIKHPCKAKDPKDCEFIDDNPTF